MAKYNTWKQINCTVNRRYWFFCFLLNYPLCCRFSFSYSFFLPHSWLVWEIIWVSAWMVGCMGQYVSKSIGPQMSAGLPKEVAKGGDVESQVYSSETRIAAFCNIWITIQPLIFFSFPPIHLLVFLFPYPSSFQLELHSKNISTAPLHYPV